MKKLILISCLFILASCTDPYELTQNKFEQIYTSAQQDSVYFNQEKTIIFVCLKGEVFKKHGSKNCNGERNYITFSKLSRKLQNKIFKVLTANDEKVAVRKLIDKVSQVTKKIFVIHPKVSGMVTNMKTKNPNKVYNEFSVILQAYGYTLLDKHDVIVIEPTL